MLKNEKHSPASNRKRRCQSGTSERPGWCQRSPVRKINKTRKLFVVLRNMTEMIHFILGSSIYQWGIMCIIKLADDWWKLVGIRRLNSGYFSGLDLLDDAFYASPWALTRQLGNNTLSVLYVLTVLSQHHAFPSQLRVHLWRFINTLARPVVSYW